MATQIKQSKLTEIAEARNQTGYKILSGDAISWLKKKVEEIKQPYRVVNSIAAERSRQTSLINLGKMYFFKYDPKTKADLPYWDVFPVIIVLEKYNDGFLGLNLHYLPVNYRVAFLKKLMKFAQKGKEDEIKRLRVTYEILTATKRYPEFRPCIKRYLYTHLRSRLLIVEPDEWDTAIMLPLQQFRGARPVTIWKDSVAEIREHMAYFNKEEA